MPFLITSHTLLYTKIYINTMKPLQLNCRRTISLDRFRRVKLNCLSTSLTSYWKPCHSLPLLPERLDSMENIGQILSPPFLRQSLMGLDAPTDFLWWHRHKTVVHLFFGAANIVKISLPCNSYQSFFQRFLPGASPLYTSIGLLLPMLMCGRMLL